MSRRYDAGDDGGSMPSVRSRLRSLGAIAHFDPMSGATDDGTTSRWVDCIGGHVVQSTSAATRLVYSASLAGLNGRPGWTGTFANSTRLDSINGTLAGLLDVSAPMTIYAVKKTGAQPSTGAWASCGNSASSDHIYWGVTVASSANKFIASRNQAGVQVTNTTSVIRPLTEATVTSSVFSGAAYSTWENGGPTALAEANARAPVCDRFTIGAVNAAGVYAVFFEGVIGDIVIFGTAHTDAQRRYVEQLLASKYGWPVIQGVAGFTNADYARAAADAGTRGTTGVGVWGDILLRADAVPAVTGYETVNIGGFTGWGIFNAAGVLTAQACNGVAAVGRAAGTIAANDVGKLKIVGMSSDATQVSAFYQGASSGSSVLAGYTLTQAGIRFAVGNQSGAALPATNFSIFGVASGNGPQTAGNAAGRAAAIKAAKRFVASGGATAEHGWAFTNATDASFSDLVGAAALAREGTLTQAQIIIPTWPW